MEIFSFMCPITSLFKAELIVMVYSFKKWTAKEKHTSINHVRGKNRGGGSQRANITSFENKIENISPGCQA